VFKANDEIVEVLKANGALLHLARLEHSYPHCWRHKTPIIFRATPQWFISMDQNGLRKQALQAIRDVKWMPGWGQARIESMVENRPDWCISRQRHWGVPITLFVHKTSGELHPQTNALMEQVAERIEAAGIDAWFDLDPADLLGGDAEQYDKVTDILDVWFDSGVTHVGVLERRDDLSCPADLYLEGSDQHRGWFQSSLLASMAIRGGAPYRSVLTHGFTVDAKGMKMSKSRGNVVAPQKVANSLGADILRLWVASTDYSGEMSVSDEILKRMADAYRRIRNTARFLLANITGFEPAQHMVDHNDMLALDQWAVHRAAQLQFELQQAYEDYEFHAIYQKIHNFCAVPMGSFYLDIVKDRQYTTQENSLARRSTQTAMYHIIEAMTRWLAPILSFTAEEIWRYIPGDREDSVLLAQWYDLSHALEFAEAEAGMDAAFWSQVIAVREGVSKVLEKVRVAGKIGSSLDAEVTLYVDPQLHELLLRLGDELRFVLITSAADVRPLEDKPGDAEESQLSNQKTIWVRASASPHAKCVRCWHHRADVGRHADHPELCGRCVANVTGTGEQRRYA
jgi:isoleucyl-tRNA synthetase